MPVLGRLIPQDTTAMPSEARASSPSSCVAPSNVAALILAHTRSAPARTALLLAGEGDGLDRQVTYGELGAHVATFARGFDDQELKPGDRLLVLLPPSLELYALAIASLARGITLVLVDGRMAHGRIVAALDDARAAVVIAPSALMRWWPLLSPLRRARRFCSDGRLLGTKSLDALCARATTALEATAVHSELPAIVSFTSGSTGRAKAIVRTHGVLAAQHAALAAAFPPFAHEVNLPGFPVAVLHNLCCGATTVLPDGQAAVRNGVDIATLLDLVRRNAVTSLSASPALIGRLAAEAVRARQSAPSLQRIVVGGGPVSRQLCKLVLRAFPAADARIIYGATEAEPIATVRMSETLVAHGRGYLVGRPALGTTIRIVAIGAPRAATRGSAGEVWVRGAHVVGGGRDDAEDGAGGDGWHRTGDIGCLDERGRLWLLGARGAAVRHGGRVVHPFIVEAEAMSVAGVRAAGFVGRPVAAGGALALCVEDDLDPRPIRLEVRARLLALGVGDVPIFLCRDIPMDARHGSKVLRAELARAMAREHA